MAGTELTIYSCNVHDFLNLYIARNTKFTN